MKFEDICKIVKKKDGTHPKESSVRECVQNFKLKRNPVGRPKGSRSILEKQRLDGSRRRPSPKTHAHAETHARAHPYIYKGVFPMTGQRGVVATSASREYYQGGGQANP